MSIHNEWSNNIHRHTHGPGVGTVRQVAVAAATLPRVEARPAMRTLRRANPDIDVGALIESRSGTGLLIN